MKTVIDNKDEVIEESPIKKTTKKIKKPELLSVTWNKCKRDSYRSIFIDNTNKQFIVRTERKNEDARDIPYPFGKSKKESLSTILEHGDFFCFNVHKIYPKDGEFAELYKK